jgi:hypothetical protein
MQCCPRISPRSSGHSARGACKNFQRTFTTGAATTTGSAINHPELTLRSQYCASQQLTIAMQQSTYKSVFQASWRTDVKKISVSFAAAAVLAMTAVTGAVAGELPSYQKAGLPVSAVQLQVMGAEGVSEVPPAALSATPVQLSVLTPRHKTKTAEVPSETTGRAIH